VALLYTIIQPNLKEVTEGKNVFDET